jgi:hypothetical protein
METNFVSIKLKFSGYFKYNASIKKKRDVDEIFDGDDEESSESSESEQAPAVPQTDIGKEPAPQVSTPPSEGEKQADTAQ